jgi:nucleotide-binding universal stress UspA family protein
LIFAAAARFEHGSLHPPWKDWKMYKRILVAIDESDTSKLALNEAIALAKDQKGTLQLLHVVDLMPAYTDVEAPYALEYQEALRAAGQKLIENYSSLARAAEIEFEAKMRVVETFDRHIYDAIEEEAKQWGADLIVIGTHGRKGFRRLLLGSVAEGVIRVSTKPVLLIRGT